MKINSSIVKLAKVYVKDYLSEHLDNKFEFHNLDHTISVVKSVNTICFETGIAEQEKEIIQVAAWFHDLGYTERMDDHEDAGALLAEKFLQRHNVDAANIEKVKNCIIATHYPQYPLTLSEKILCDADMVHLADKNYFERAQLLRNEWSATRDKKFSDTEWISVNIQFLSQHSYHTIYCREKLGKRKQKNIRELLTMTESIKEGLDIYRESGIIEERKKKNKDKQDEYGRGVETFFKIISSNHMRLSGMADNKAHILLSVNSIIISVVLSVLAKKITEANYLIIPTAFLVCVCLTAMVFAVLTTRPKISRNKPAAEFVNVREMNLLFFGHFHRMKPETYQGSVNEMLRDKEYLYKTLTKDVYYLGKILAVKYRYLSIGYMIFMLGLIVSVFMYAIGFFVSHQAIG